jgi:type II secretory pathway component GspD/PulD (secretin)
LTINGYFVNINKEKKNHEKVASYLAQVKKNASAQVLIEAKVVEVSLSDKFRAGIDWSQDLFKFNSPDADTNFAPMATLSNPAMKIFGGDINIAVDAMSKFGSTKAISSPRIHAMNISRIGHDESMFWRAGRDPLLKNYDWGIPGSKAD